MTNQAPGDQADPPSVGRSCYPACFGRARDVVIYDLSVPLQPGLPTYDDEPGPELAPLKTIAADGVNVSQLSLGVHSGTHVDAPVHFISGGGGVDQVPLEAMLGPCLVVVHPGTADITADDL